MGKQPPREFLAWYVLHYWADTGDLTFAQHGCYSNLLWIAWERGGPLPDDPRLMVRLMAARVADCTAKSYPQVIRPLLERYFVFDPQNRVWRQNRLEMELKKSISLSATRREVASIGWQKRKQINGSAYANAGQLQSKSNARQTDRHIGGTPLGEAVDNSLARLGEAVARREAE